MAKVIFSKNPETYIPALAEALKKIPEFEVPNWAYFVKSGTHKQRPPVNDDFWYIRAAAILRQLYIRGVVGVGRLRTRFGGRKDRGGRPDEFRKAGGKIIRLILQQAENAGLVEKISRGQHGRRLTQKGRDFLDSINVEEKTMFKFEDIKISARPEEEMKEEKPVEEEKSIEEETLQEASEDTPTEKPIEGGKDDGK